MPLHDLACDRCGRELYDQYIPVRQLKRVRPCPDCGAPMDRRWDISRRPIGVAKNTTVHPRERAVVWHNPKTGQTAYPPQNDVPMPERYERQGYQRVEFDGLRKLDRFCRENKVSNEGVEFDRNGIADRVPGAPS